MPMFKRFYTTTIMGEDMFRIFNLKDGMLDISDLINFKYNQCKIKYIL